MGSTVTRRAVDIVVASAALAAMSVPLLFIALLIKLTSRGPALYSAPRIGRGGVPFAFYKFRTMTESNAGPHITVGGDTRITRVGRVLRKLKLDEVPQFLNVLRGDMTLIGPRPEVECFVCRYTADQRPLLGYRPGLASLSTIMFSDESEALRGYADPEDAYVTLWMPRKIAVDLDYERTRTARSDARLAARIAWLVVAGRPRLADSRKGVAA